MYGRESCPHCVVMKERLRKDGVIQEFRYIEVTSDYGKKEFDKTSARSVPYFVNEASGKTTTGSMKTSELIDVLESKPSFKNVVVYGSLSCGYTVKLIDELKKNKVWNDVSFVDVDTKEGATAFKTLDVSGVPISINNASGAIVHGYLPFKDFKQKLNIV
tara:strand:+ start:2453 stop:2932 length:480 start_codon:yes stop_codon:yes gene_type:complete